MSEKDRFDEHERQVSALVVQVNEPDVYTPTVDLALPKHGPPPVFRPGVRRVLRTHSEEKLELAVSEQEAALGELRAAVEKYQEEERSLMPWVWGLLAVFLAASIVVVFASR